MTKSSSFMGVLAAWVVTVVAVAFAVGLSIEHPEYLSTPLATLALTFSFVFVGLPLGFGLLVVQQPVFDGVLRRGGSIAEASRASIIANAIYAAILTIPLLILVFLFGSDLSVGVGLRAMAVLVACSLITSLIWLCCNHLLLREKNDN